jgi:hypothetical protein
MPVTSNANGSGGIVDAINDTIWRQNELPNVAIHEFANDAARSRKRGERLRLLDQRKPQFLGGLWTIRTNVEHNISKIGYRSRCDDYFVVHEAIIFSTSARGTPSPRSS